MRSNLIAIILVATTGLALAETNDATAQRICGPRVCEYVLHWYRQPAEAIDLVWEMQEGRAEQPVDLATVATTLEKRGIKTQAIKLTEPGLVDWPKVCIYHTLNSNGTGHFLVQVPPEEGRPRLFWCNYLGFSRTLHPEYAGRLTGYVLLTSNEEIPANAIEELTSTRLSGVRWWLWGPLAALASGLVIWVCSRRKLMSYTGGV
jgi:hypothetical protein